MVVNPASANGRTAHAWPDIARRAENMGLAADVRLTEAPQHAIQLTRDALAEGARLIVAVGGDGTVSEVVNGFFADGQPVAPQAELAVIMRGSGCDFVRTYRIPRQVDRALAVAAGARRAHDRRRLGRVHRATTGSRPAAGSPTSPLPG